MKYFYGMRLRGFSPGCQPMEGLIERLDSKLSEYFDIVVYNRPLSEDEEKHYSLTPLNACEIRDNRGEDATAFFTDYQNAVDNALSTLKASFIEYSELFPDIDVAWENQFLIFGNESEVYVPGSDYYTKVILYEPIARIKDYVKRSQYPIKVGSLEFVLIGVNMHDDADEDELLPCSNSEDKYLSFRDRYNRALKELERLTRRMTFKEAKTFFRKNATGDEAYYYGNYYYIYTKKESPKYIAFGVRMD